MKRAALIVLTVIFCLTLTSAAAIDLSQFSIDNISDEPEIPPGAYGVFSIPLIDVSIPMYCGDPQTVVDAPNSAWYGLYDKGAAILDHYGQDGLTLTKTRINDGLWIYYADGNWIYAKCITVTKGENHGNYYADMNGDRIKIAEGDYLVACCTDDNTADVIIAIFREY